MLEFLKDYPKEDLWLVVDGYHFNENYHHKLKNIGVRLIVFDDIGHLKFYSADIIINQNIFAKKIKYSRSSDSKLLLGEKYFLLRNEFLRVKKNKKHGHIRRILVTMGGSDNKNITVMMINALNHLRGEVYEIFVILGPHYKEKFELNAICNRSPHKIKKFYHVKDMSNLMKRVDFAISAGGSTCMSLVI